MWKTIKGLFGGAERPKRREDHTPEVQKTFKETGERFEGRPHGFDQTNSVEYAAQQRRARELAERVAAEMKLAEAKEQDWPDVVEPTDENTGVWTGKNAN